ASLGRRPSAHVLNTKNGLERIDHGISDVSHIFSETRRKADVSHIQSQKLDRQRRAQHYIAAPLIGSTPCSRRTRRCEPKTQGPPLRKISRSRRNES
ncbi:hypothetical protein, partial [Xanthomonas euvesicatoria]|uniref:hypothetical protein n=1 Tax=Xanthomonas euvesicatoria TaxID=456327 RepID=UPI001C4787E7